MASWTADVKAALIREGCHFDRQGKGDHEIWYSPHTDRRFPVDHKILSRHTANAIMKQAGLAHRWLILCSGVMVERVAVVAFPG